MKLFLVFLLIILPHISTAQIIQPKDCVAESLEQIKVIEERILKKDPQLFHQSTIIKSASIALMFHILSIRRDYESVEHVLRTRGIPAYEKKDSFLKAFASTHHELLGLTSQEKQQMLHDLTLTKNYDEMINVLRRLETLYAGTNFKLNMDFEESFTIELRIANAFTRTFFGFPTRPGLYVWFLRDRAALAEKALALAQSQGSCQAVVQHLEETDPSIFDFIGHFLARPFRKTCRLSLELERICTFKQVSFAKATKGEKELALSNLKESTDMFRRLLKKAEEL